MSLDLEFPLRLGRGENDRHGHFYNKGKATKATRESVAWVLYGETKPATPCKVLITRIAPGNGLDDDNLAGACKPVRDEFARWIGVNDRRSDVVKYEYAQRRGTKGEWGVRIQVIA